MHECTENAGNSVIIVHKGAEKPLILWILPHCWTTSGRLHTDCIPAVVLELVS